MVGQAWLCTNHWMKGQKELRVGQEDIVTAGSQKYRAGLGEGTEHCLTGRASLLQERNMSNLLSV